MRKDAVRLGRSVFHYLIPYPERKWNVHEAVAVHMPDFAVTDSEFRPTEAVWGVRELISRLHLP